MKPLIGLSPTPHLTVQDHGTFRLNTLNENYTKAVQAAGGLAMMLPPHQSDIPALLDRLDGVIITGGGDVDPTRYGQERHAKTEEVDDERDAFEIAVIEEAIRRDMPILGICRGLQILNVALGGTLHQDVDDLVPDSHQHKQHDEKVEHTETYQTATLTPGANFLRDIVKIEAIEINTFHHQCLDRVSDSLQTVATTEDGIVEAVVHPGLTFGLAVQWHPEMLAPSRPEHAAIFQALVEAAHAYHLERNKELVTP